MLVLTREFEPGLIFAKECDSDPCWLKAESGLFCSVFSK